MLRRLALGGNTQENSEKESHDCQRSQLGKALARCPPGQQSH